ncbi:MAG: discoidin domain-containing protein, partial [Clostridia bacterium]|nr:discoidin domain-containing protein [Clostridia bacterium]
YHMVCDESYLISKLYGNIEEMNAARAFAASFGSKLGALGILWYEPLGDSNAYKSYPLDYVLKSIQLVSAKATWGEPNSAYFSAIGGAIELSSSHWDKGSFIFDDDGVRWFSDMGAEAYELADGSSHYGAAGAYIFRKRAEGHNCLLINPSAEDPGQVTGAYAALSRFETKPRGIIAEYDLAEVYGDKVTSYKRGFLFGDNRNSLVVQDEVELSKPNSEIYHYLYTTGKVEVSPDKKTAYITEDGKTLKIEYICDASSWHVEAQAANSLFPELHKAGEHSRASYTRVALVGKASGKLNISIKCTVEDELETYEPHRLVPMSQWTLPDGEIPPKPEIDAIYVNGEPLADFEPLKNDYSISLTADTPIPVFTATSTTGTVEVIAPETLNDYARLIVSNEHGKRAYRIKFNFIIRETENLMDTKPVDGIPADVKKLKVAYCYADHNPQTDNSDKNAVDDNLETRWSSDVKPSFIEVDVGEVTNISGVALAYMDSQRFYKYDILVSKDKINYEKIYTGTSSGLKNEWDYLPLGVDARYVRYVGYGHADGEWNSILEFRPCGKQ